jgi:threonine aldolase
MNDDRSVDLRSDTVTRPTPAMRRAMAEAEVGDDVYGEDPTVRRLEERAAERVGTGGALFVPTGSMGNQIAVNVFTTPGTEVIVEETSHTYNYELGAMAAWSGAVPRVVRGERGKMTPDQVRRALSPDLYYMSPTSLIVLENTHNHAGGVVTTPAECAAVLEVVKARGLPAHLDGARVFHAAVALGVPVGALTRGFDSTMFCLSKGLGAPIGSMLCGSVEFVREARVVRKRMGGGLRQVGVIAAAGLVALEHHVDRLVEDHARAGRLAARLADHPAFSVDPGSVETNIVIADAVPRESASDLIRALAEQGVLAGPMGEGRVRFVTHLDVDDASLDRALEALDRLA